MSGTATSHFQHEVLSRPEDATRSVVLALDIGGTLIKAALVDRSGVEVAGSSTATPAGLGSDLGQVIERLRTDLLTQAGSPPLRVVGCGVVTPGIVDDHQGMVINAVNLGWRQLPVRDIVARHTGLPTALGHDVRAGLRAEAQLGGARGIADIAFVPVGTGIAAALQIDGAILSAGGWAGELGHVVIEPEGPLCACGQQGCLETLAAAPALVRAYAGRTGRTRPAHEIAELAKAGDPAAVAVWTSGTDALARGLTVLVALTGVELVILAGGLAESGDLLLEPLRRAFADRPAFGRPVRIERARLGDHAGVLGAALIGWAAIDADPER
jgi:glucokinase